jgi:hypothetical protein
MEALPFYIPRAEMPQVDEIDYPALLAYLESNSIAYRHCTVEANSLRVHQQPDQFDGHNFPAALLAKPCLVASDWFILDGHHRALAHAAEGTPCPVIWLSAPFAQAIILLFGFAHTYTTQGKN